MGTAHGAEELGLCPHGLACHAGARGHYIGFCLGYGHIWKIQTNNDRQKYYAKPIRAEGTPESDEYGAYTLRFSEYVHILGKTLWWRPQAPAWQASPWNTAPAPRHHVRCP